MDTRHLRAFMVIAQTGSISRAAELLALTQPAVSQSLLRLEDEVGCKLFQRTPRGVVATDAGRVFERYARDIIELADRTLEELAKLSTEHRVRVSVAMPYSISRLAGIVLMETAMQQLPNVSLRLVEAYSAPARAMIENGAVNLALIYDDLPLDGLSVRPLMREGLRVVGPPGQLQDGAVMSVKEIAALTLILPATSHPLRQFLDREAQRVGVKLKVAPEVDALEHITRLVSDGVGFSILPVSAVQREINSGAISAAQIADSAFAPTLCLVQRLDSPASELIRKAEAMVISVLARTTADDRWIDKAAI